MATVVKKVVDHYYKAMEAGDPRTADWPFMSTPWSTLGLVTLYVITVILGPRIMKDKEAFNLKWFLVLYNLGLVALSIYMLSEVGIV